MNNTWDKIPSDEIIEKTVKALNKNDFHATVVENGEEAAAKVYELVPEGADVQLNTSITLEKIGVMEKIDKSGKYNSHRAKIFSLDHHKDEEQIRILRSVADYALGSVHAITHDGRLMIASKSGSNIPTYAYGGKHIIFVVGAQKIVTDLNEGFERINKYTLPLESERARKAYGLPEDWHSFPEKILIYNKDLADRVHVIIIKEVVGF